MCSSILEAIKTTDISDIVEAIQPIQVVLSFALGLALGVVSRATGLKRGYSTYGATIIGPVVSSHYHGYFDNYLIDVGAATFGTVVGARLVDRAARIMYDNK